MGGIRSNKIVPHQVLRLFENVVHIAPVGQHSHSDYCSSTLFGMMSILALAI